MFYASYNKVNEMWLKDIIMNELIKVVKPLDIKVVELLVKENKSGLSINVVIEKGGGVTIDDCEKVTRLLNDRLSMLQELEVENYRLQVSSPGLSRVFKKKDEYNIFKSRNVKIILKEPLNSNSEKLVNNLTDSLIYEGTLLGLEDDIVKIRDNTDRIVEIPYDKIQKTKLNG